MQGLTTRVRDALQYIKSLEIKTFKLHLTKQVNNKLFPFLRENHKVTIKRKPAHWDIIGNKINVRFLVIVSRGGGGFGGGGRSLQKEKNGGSNIVMMVVWGSGVDGEDKL